MLFESAFERLRFEVTPNMMPEKTAVMISVIQKAFQTPEAPAVLLRIKAAGRMMITYLKRETQSDAPPLPSPSSAPETVTLSADGINPMQISRSA